MKWLVRFGVVVAVFLVVLAFTFPTTEIVRWALAQVTPADTTITFTEASVRPWGLRVDGVAVRASDGRRILDAPWLRMRPSVLGFFRNGMGQPWHVGAGLCLGSVEGSLESDANAQVLGATWEDIDLGTCLPMIGSPFAMSGRSTGTIDLRILPAGPESGSGELRLRGAAWAPPLPDLEDVVLHADTALVTWSLAGPTLTLTEVAADGPELTLAASGTVRLDPRNRGASALRLKVTLTPRADAPDLLRDLLDGLPHRDGTYDFLLTGTIDAPRAEPAR